MPDLLKKPKILVIGDVMVDRYWHGDSSRISPEAPVPVVHIDDVVDRPGGAGNVVLNLLDLDCEVVFMTVLGDDACANYLEETFSQLGVKCCFFRQASHQTTLKLRIVHGQQQMIRADFEKPCSAINTFSIASTLKKTLKEVDLCLFSDYNKGVLSEIPSLIEMCRLAKVPCVLDPKPGHVDAYKGVSYIAPNLSESELILKQAGLSNLSFDQAAETLMSRYDWQAILYKKGRLGMSLYVPGKPAIDILASANEVCDVTGAGDTVVAAFTAFYAMGYSLEESARFSSAAAGLVVAKHGAASVSKAQLLEHSNQADVKRGCFALKDLSAQIDMLRAKGKRIIFTNGCFDILHRGHLACFDEAKCLGDWLIVGLNSDASIKRLKGDTRPINCLEDRIGMLTALQSVDWVVPFEDDTPLKLIEAIKPDVLLKGGDYNPSSIIGADFVESYGGQVVTVPLAKGWHQYKGLNTTKIIDQGSVKTNKDLLDT
jgi:D-beta-D-heptose 7-phosphate kinase / D-beta-D-heptose 1-phosphate adenosyltransferase